MSRKACDPVSTQRARPWTQTTHVFHGSVFIDFTLEIFENPILYHLVGVCGHDVDTGEAMFYKRQNSRRDAEKS